MALLKTVFLITLTTSRMIFPGIPAETSSTEMGITPAARSITFDLLCSKGAPENPEALVMVPNGLGVGDSVSLEVTPVEAEEGEESLSYASYARWPGVKPGHEGKKITDEAKAAGEYQLKSYCGDVGIKLDQTQDFMAPVDFVGFEKQADLDKEIKIEWKPVPNAVAYFLVAYGGNEDESITWSSSTQPNPPYEIEYEPVSEKQLKEYLEKKVLLSPDQTTCTIPAGHFKGSNSVLLTVVALGKDIVKTQDGINANVVLRSSASAPLYTKPFKPSS